MVFWEGYISDEMIGMIAPIAMYWVYGGAYQLLFLLQLSSSEHFRLHTREEEEEKNLLQLPAVAKGVLLQQLFQAIVVHLLFFLTFESSPTKEVPQPPILVRLVQFFVVMYATDAWQYFIHRYMHENKFLYCHIRSRHHLLIVPYAVGALYNHPLEELFVDTLRGAISFLVSEMTLRTAVYFCFSTIRAVDEHCSMLLPGNLFHIFFENSSAYHDIHHSLRRSKYNYSQPFSPFWGKVMGTHMPYTDRAAASAVSRRGSRKRLASSSSIVQSEVTMLSCVHSQTEESRFEIAL